MTMQTYKSKVREYTVEEKTLNGKTYIVVPVTMMMEGVHQGSHGALLHTAEELGKIPASWNGIPVTLGHPQAEGSPVSANSPTILEQWALGIVFNTVMAGNRLKSEAWLDKDKLATNVNLNDRIANGELIEVSVGVFSEDEMTEGTWHNEQYVAVARNLRPDHLAILPNQVGACSVADGCGIRVNQNKKGEITMTVNEALDVLKADGYRVPTITDNSDMGLMEKIDELRDLVRAIDENSWTYLEEVYDGYLIYCQENQTGEKCYKRNFQFNVTTGTPEFTSDPVEVVKKVEYETVITNNTVVKRTRKTNLKKEDVIMANEKCTPCIAKKAGELIANAATSYVEADREWLETLEEGQLDKMVPKVVETKEATITPEMAVNAFKEGLKAEEDYIALMPTVMQEQMRSALKVNSDHKQSLIDGIITNTEEGTWTKEELAVYEVAKLEKIAKTANVRPQSLQVNYAGAAAGMLTVQNNEQSGIPLLEPAGIKFK